MDQTSASISPMNRLSLLADSAAACLLASAGSGAAPAEPLQLKPRTGLKPFTYTNSPDALPNYVVGAKWGTQAEPIRTMQVPLSPEESAQHLVLPPGFESKLWAAEPDIKKPICLAWDERGRLW